MSKQPPSSDSLSGDPMASTQTIRRGLTQAAMNEARLAFLAKLPFFLNSSLKLQRVVHIALEHILEELKAEIAVVHLVQEDTDELEYWALKREGKARLEGNSDFERNPAVEMAITNKFPLVHESGSDFPGMDIDPVLGATLKNMLCMPLLVKGGESCVGSLQIINRKSEEPFSLEDISFIEQFSHQLALAIDNARLFQEAEHRRTELQKLDRRKSEMISIIAHEFRTPLNVIHNASELLTSEMVTEDNKGEMVDLLQSSVERLTRLITQIRNVSFVQDDGIKLAMQAIDAGELCQEAVEKYREIADGRNLQLNVILPDDPVTVLGEARMLSIVLGNLLSNAIRFTPDGGVVELLLEQGERKARISVRDTGIGIPEEEQGLIFEKFYEVKDLMSHTSGNYEFQSSGLGLGLAAVRHILQAHRSNIELKSEPGRGSNFYFMLQLTQ